MTILKVSSDNGTIKTYIVLDNCFSIKSREDEQGKPVIVFRSSTGQIESFTFNSKKSRDAYLEALEQEELIYDNLIVDDDFPEDEEDESEEYEEEHEAEKESTEDYLASYDPMKNLE